MDGPSSKQSAKFLTELLERAVNNDQQAKDQLILSYSPFIRSASKTMLSQYGAVAEPEDLFQEGMVGLITAINDRTYWTRFGDYARRKIKEHIEVAVMAELRADQLKTSLRRDFLKYRNVMAELFNKLKRQPTLSELSKQTGFSKEKSEQLERIYQTALNYETE